jgi:hypothetical protein
METWEDDDGNKWVSCDALATGDYSGSGDIGAANIRFLQERDDCRVRRGAHSSRQAWLADTVENRELVRDLEEDYPLLDEETHGQVQAEQEEELFEGFLDRELCRHLEKEYGPAIREWAEDVLTADDRWELYRAAMEEENEYVIWETGGPYVRTSKIKGAFARLVADRALAAARAESGLDGTGTAGVLVMADWLEEHGSPQAGALREVADELRGA